MRAARRAAGYSSARDFATRHEIPESTYSQHETGKRSLSVNMLLRYSEVLNANPGWLLTGVGVPYHSEVNRQLTSQEDSDPTNRALANRMLDAITPLFAEYNIYLTDQRISQICLELCYCFLRMLSIADPKKA